jgi:localization factor PodJL
MARNGQGFDMAPSGSIGPATATFSPNRGAPAAQPTPAPPVASLPTDAPATSVTLPLRDAALSGNAAAQYELGARLAEGRSMPRDPKAAAEWFNRAAAQGLAPAEFRLGVVYEKGLGLAQDLPLARAWYERAALAGHAHAMHNLAVVLAEGAGGKPNYPEAANWFRKAAEFGIRDSQYNLAILYARGLGIEQDFTQSYVWFSLAAAQGDEDAGKKRDEVAKRLDADALATAKTQIDAFHAKQPDRAANEVDPPPGGWDPPAKPASKTPAARPKVSSL